MRKPCAAASKAGDPPNISGAHKSTTLKVSAETPRPTKARPARATFVFGFPGAIAHRSSAGIFKRACPGCGK
jgi:hypothetical protein